MDGPELIFFVPALNSFHVGVKKAKVEARKRFDTINIEEPKLPSLFSRLKPVREVERKDKTAAAKQLPSRPVIRTSALKNRASITKALVSNTVHVAAHPIGLRAQSTAHRPAERDVTSMSEDPCTTAIRSRRSVRHLLPTLLGMVISGAKAPGRLPTSQVTPSPEVERAEAGTIPRSEPMRFLKVGGTSRSMKTSFPKSEKRGVAAEPVTPKLAVQSRAPRAPVKTATTFKSVHLLAPRPQVKVIRNARDKRRSSKVIRETTPTATLAKMTSPHCTNPAKTAIEEELPSSKAVKAKISIILKVEKDEDIRPDASIPKASIPTEEMATLETAIVHEETAIEEVSKKDISVETIAIAEEKIDDTVDVETIAPSGIVDISERDGVPSPKEDTNIDLTKEIERVICSNTNSTLVKIDSLPKRVQLRMMDELKNALEHRKENSVFKDPVTSKIQKEEIIFQRRPLANKHVAVNQQKQLQPEPARSAVAPAVASGIQARIAAMYASAGVNGLRAPIVTGARVCQFKVPELLETDKASKDVRIQREVEALRTMNKVGTNSAALVKTRAFGGSEPHNAAANTVHEGRTLPLHCKNVVDRIKKEQSQRGLVN